MNALTPRDAFSVPRMAQAPRAVEAELLGADATVRVIGASHPFRARDVDCRCPAGLSVAELLELALIDTPAKPWHGFVTWVDGRAGAAGVARACAREAWPRRGVPGGPGEGRLADHRRGRHHHRRHRGGAVYRAAVAARFPSERTATSLVAAEIAIGGQLASTRCSRCGRRSSQATRPSASNRSR